MVVLLIIIAISIAITLRFQFYSMSVERKGLICRRYVSDILQEITRVREKVGDLFSYDWISVPLVYSQVFYSSYRLKRAGQIKSLIRYSEIFHFSILTFQLVTLAVYSYFVAALFGRQGLDDSNGKSINGYKHIGGFFDSIPLFLTLEFLFFIGWLKAAEVLINPYGKIILKLVSIPWSFYCTQFLN